MKPGIKFNQTKMKSLQEGKPKTIKIGRIKTLADLLKPTHSDSKIPFEFMKKKKRNHSQHL